MNRTALIKSLTNLADVHNSEGELFLEMLLRKISSEKESEQNFQIPDLGSLKYSSSPHGLTFAFTDDANVIYFSLPQETSLLRHSIFSLSIGKPVFPVNTKQFSVSLMQNPSDYLNTLEAKAERMLELLQDISVEDMISGKTPETVDANIFDELTDSTVDEIAELSFDDAEENAMEMEGLQEEKFSGSILAENNFEADEFLSETETIPESQITEGQAISEPENSLEEVKENNIDVIEEVPEVGIIDENIISEKVESISEPNGFLQDLASDEEVIEANQEEVESETFEIPASEQKFVEPELKESAEEVTAEEESLDLNKAELKEVPFEVPIPENQSPDDSMELLSEIQLPEETAFEVEYLEVGKQGEAEVLDLEEEFDLADLRDEESPGGKENPAQPPQLSPFDEEFLSAEEFLNELNPESSAAKEIIPDNQEISFLELADKNSENPEEKSIGEIAERREEDNSSSELFTNIIDNINETDEPEPKTSNTDADNFQRVKSLTREFFSMSEVEQKQKMLTWDFGESEQLDKEIKAVTRSFDEPVKSSEKTKEGFTIVQGKKATMEWVPGTLPDLEKNLELPDEDEYVGEINLEIAEQTSPEATVTETIKLRTREHKSHRSFLIIAGIIVCIGLAVLAYYKLNSSADILIKRDIQPVVIERNDKIPVMIEGNLQKESESAPAFEEQVTPPAETRAEIIRVSDGLYQKGSAFYVQVSSWQTKYKADKEAERYQLHGYKTEIQNSYLNSGTWYRLLVGEFGSANEATDFLKNNTD